MWVLPRDRHIIGGVVVVDFYVVEGATAHVNVDLRVVEEDLDDIASAPLCSNDEGRDLFEELHYRVRDRPSVLPDVDIVRVCALHLQHLAHLHNVVVCCVVQDLRHGTHGVVGARGDRHLGVSRDRSPFLHRYRPEGLDEPSVLLVSHLGDDVGEVSDIVVPCLLEVPHGPLDESLALLLIQEGPFDDQAIQGICHHLLGSGHPQRLIKVGARHVSYNHLHPLPRLRLQANDDKEHHPIHLPDEHARVVNLQERALRDELMVVEKQLIAGELTVGIVRRGGNYERRAIHLAIYRRALRERACRLWPLVCLNLSTALVGH
mmetsp:Transcript_45859/g.97983  ORF Transcript_45859/g.97983 Transcript_45859/m.97983 type:complete len:319 (+) Transcript_45859:564-1520(+)